MPGAGINGGNIKMMKETGAREFHLTGIGMNESQMKFRKEGIFMGGLPEIPEFEIAESDIGKMSEVAKVDEIMAFQKK